MDILYVLYWRPTFTLVFNLCPAIRSWMASQEKAKRVKKCSEMQSLATLGAVLLFGLVEHGINLINVVPPLG